MNDQLQQFARNQIITGLAKLPESHCLLFKRMYSFQDLEKNIDAVVDEMDEEKLDWALTQVENSLAKEAQKTLEDKDGLV